MTLDTLGRDELAVIVALDSRGDVRRRLMDLGFLPGTEIRVGMSSPLGDPTAYIVRGSTIALRRAQARTVRVERQAAGGEA